MGCVGDSRTPRPARSPPFAGPLAAVEGVVTVRGRLPVTVPRPGDGPGPLARGSYEPSPRQRWLRCRRLGGDGPSSPPGLGVGRGGGCGERTLDSRTIPSRTFFLRNCEFRPGRDGPSPPPGLGVGVGKFLRLWVRVVRESAARLEIVLQARLQVSARSPKHFLFL